MQFDCNKAECMKKYCAYCCTFKQDMLRNNAFEKTIEILPRIIVCDKFERCGTYFQPLTVRNKGTKTRRMKFIVEPNSDVSFKVQGDPELISEASVTVEIYIEPVNKTNINRHRFFYVFTEHPDIVWEIPIILVSDPPEVFIPEHICLHKVPANTVSYYQFVLYNPLPNDVSFTTCTCYENFEIIPNTGTIPKQDYMKILLTGKVPARVTTSSLVVTLSIGKSQRIFVHMEPTDQILYLSTCVVTFDDTFMGTRTQQNIHICNKSLECASFQWTCTEANELVNPGEENQELVISEFLTIRSQRGCIPPLGSALSIITFFPPTNYEYNEDEEPPYKVNIFMYLFSPVVGPHSYRLQIIAGILGPEIELTPRDINVGSIYLGQIQCLTFRAENKGPIDGEVYFKEHTDINSIQCLVKPRAIQLKPKDAGIFDFTFYRQVTGKFLTKITFKIRRGNSIPILLRGNAESAKVKIWPESFELGVVPICIPQKRFALVANPLPVPVVVEPQVANDGMDDPMVLCVDYSKLPLHSRPATYYPEEHRKPVVEDEDLAYSDFELNKKFDPTKATPSELSWMFRDTVLEDIPEMAADLLKTVRVLTPQYQPEPGMKIIDAALDCILNRTDYFDELKHKQNYMHIDWEELPTNAKEVAIEAERFYLKPNESKSFPIIIIPNGSGPNSKVIEFKACPMGVENPDLVSLVTSKSMVRSLSLEYNCIVPKLMFKDKIKIFKPLYVELPYKLSMVFMNDDVVPGFLFFKDLPKGGKGILQIDPSKYFMAPGQTITANYVVTFLIAGSVTLEGHYQLVGKNVDTSFHISAQVLPPKLEIMPEKLIHKQQVLETTKTRIFFQNITPTIARFNVALKNEQYQQLEPLGGALAPNQKILITITSRFFDPGTFKNTLYLCVKHADRVSIPIIFNVDGTPILFEPNIKEGLDLGTVFRNDKTVDYDIEVINKGEKSYRLLLQKPKAKGALTLPPSIFCIDPTGLIMQPMTTSIFTITVDISKEAHCEELISVDGMGEDNCRFKFFSFLLKCVVIKSKVIWNRAEVCLETGNANTECDKISENVTLINTNPLSADVTITAVGSFAFTQAEGGPLEKTASFSLDGKETKQFTVFINEKEIEASEMCQCFKGSIKVRVNNKLQKPLVLHAKIVNPGLKICSPDVTLFTQNYESYAHIFLHNHGPLVAKYTWKEIHSSMYAATPVEAEEYCSKTISEIIFSLTDETALVIPTQIKPIEPEVCNADEEPWVDDVEEESHSKKSSDSGSRAVKKHISPMSSVSAKTTGTHKTVGTVKTTATKTTASAKASTVYHSVAEEKHESTSESSLTLSPQPPPLCKPLKLLSSPYLETYQINVPKILEYMGVKRTLKGDRSSTIYDLLESQESQRRVIHYDSDQDSEECAVMFQTPSGIIQPKAGHKAYMFLPRIPDGQTLTSKFELEVLGGKTENLSVTLTSLKGRIQLSRGRVDLGRQPWYKTFTEHIALTNRGPYAVKLSLIETYDCGDVENQLIHGHVQVVSPKMFVIVPDAYICIETMTILGLRYNFIEDIGIEINNNATGVPIRFEGCGLMPMITPRNLCKMARRSLDTIDSYLTIRTVYENVRAKKRDAAQKSWDESCADSRRSLSFTITGENETVSESAAGRKKPRVIASDFVALNYCDDAGPKGLEIERLIEMWKLLGELNKSPDLKKKFHEYYCGCLRRNALELESVINLKLTICRPMPWNLPVFILNMGNINTNQTRSFQLDLTFMGPGKVFLSARTRIAIPGLMAWFDDCELLGNPGCFTFFLQQPEEKKLQRYRNINERDTDAVESFDDCRLPHAHSFDFDEECIHRRKWGPPEAKKVKERFTKMTQGYKERKNPLILAEMCQTTDDNWDNTTFRLTLLFTATGSYYENTQLVEDYVYIDMHLGPTLPILLRGRVITTESSDI